MSRWLPQDNADDPVPTEGQVMGGTFECNTCSEYCHTASYVADNNTLSWVCSSGHISRIKEFLS